MSGNVKEKVTVRNNAGKKTPAVTSPMANAYANATALEKIEYLAATSRHRTCNETISRFLFFIKGNDKSYQTLQARSLRSDRASTRLGRYLATENAHSLVATQRPSTHTARSLRSDRARTQLGRYVGAEHAHRSVAT
ncbi:hypothetical protein F2Q69_00036878 [Brassica cretica]|uniref:Uncharacterized protein n=1 Tax=Brassica cretica TaxID=69181 RepID=A0A8S9SBZ4_BRACR|nr:hypothetical protein F2Q69_00036878 [Brassica cretica]